MTCKGPDWASALAITIPGNNGGLLDLSKKMCRDVFHYIASKRAKYIICHRNLHIFIERVVIQVVLFDEWWHQGRFSRWWYSSSKHYADWRNFARRKLHRADRAEKSHVSLAISIRQCSTNIHSFFNVLELITKSFDTLSDNGNFIFFGKHW